MRLCARRRGYGFGDEAGLGLVMGSMNFLGTTMPQLAQTTVDTAKALYGNAAANAVLAAFQARSIL